MPLRGSSIGIWHAEMATRLAREFDVVVYGPRSEIDAPASERFGGAEFVFFPTRRDDRVARLAGWARRIPGLGGSPRRPFFASRFCLRDFARRVSEEVRRRGCDLVYVANFSQLVSAVRARVDRVRAGLHMHCEWLTQLDSRIVVPRLRQSDLIGGCSRYVSEGVARRFPEVAPRCFALHNGVDVRLFRPAPRGEGRLGHGELRLLFVGRLSPEKGVHDLLTALPRIAERAANVRLTVIGGKRPAPFEYVVALADDPLVRDLARFYEGGPAAYEEHLRRSIPPSLADRVVFRDDVPQADLVEAYRDADVFVFPSAWNEPFGMPVAEAMACGVPVVATRGGGIPEFVEHGRSGLLVERGNPLALAEAVVTLLDQPEHRRVLGRAGRDRIERELTWDHVAGRLGEKIEEALNRPAGRA
jgi:glycosyltransferase involved in cell wall biosynthesis